jgi:hypothetical protein
MIVKAWIEMGAERREVDLEIPAEEIHQHLRAGESVDVAVMRHAFEWMMRRSAWGWSGNATSGEMASDASEPSRTRTNMFGSKQDKSFN